MYWYTDKLCRNSEAELNHIKALRRGGRAGAPRHAAPAGAYTRPLYWSTYDVFVSLKHRNHPAYPMQGAYVEPKVGRAYAPAYHSRYCLSAAKLLRQGLSLVHISPQPKPILSPNLLRPPNVSLNKCSREAEKWTIVSPWSILLHSFMFQIKSSCYVPMTSR